MIVVGDYDYHETVIKANILLEVIKLEAGLLKEETCVKPSLRP